MSAGDLVASCVRRQMSGGTGGRSAFRIRNPRRGFVGCRQWKRGRGFDLTRFLSRRRDRFRGATLASIDAYRQFAEDARSPRRRQTNTPLRFRHPDGVLGRTAP